MTTSITSSPSITPINNSVPGAPIKAELSHLPSNNIPLEKLTEAINYSAEMQQEFYEVLEADAEAELDAEGTTDTDSDKIDPDEKGNSGQESNDDQEEQQHFQQQQQQKEKESRDKRKALIINADTEVKPKLAVLQNYIDQNAQSSDKEYSFLRTSQTFAAQDVFNFAQFSSSSIELELAEIYFRSNALVQELMRLELEDQKVRNGGIADLQAVMNAIRDASKGKPADNQLTDTELNALLNKKIPLDKDSPFRLTSAGANGEATVGELLSYYQIKPVLETGKGVKVSDLTAAIESAKGQTDILSTNQQMSGTRIQKGESSRSESYTSITNILKKLHECIMTICANQK